MDVAVIEEKSVQTLVSPYQSVKPEAVNELEDVLQLYQGELLEGFWDDRPLGESERLKSQHLNSLVKLMGYHHYQVLYGKAIDLAREQIHQALQFVTNVNVQVGAPLGCW